MSKQNKTKQKKISNYHTNTHTQKETKNNYVQHLMNKCHVDVLQGYFTGAFFLSSTDPSAQKKITKTNKFCVYLSLSMTVRMALIKIQLCANKNE